jgi:hypothetical protein
MVEAYSKDGRLTLTLDLAIREALALPAALLVPFGGMAVTIGKLI